MRTIFIAALALFAGSIATNAILVLIVALPFEWLWNATLPGLFPIHRVDYFQAAGILGLAAMFQLVVMGAKIKGTMRDS